LSWKIPVFKGVLRANFLFPIESILQVLKLDMESIIVISKMKNRDFAVYFFQNVQGGKANTVLLSLADYQWAV